MQRLDEENKFIVNGLSDVRKGLKGESVSKSVTNEANQGFDVKYDRSVCPIPWWMDSLRLIDTVQTSESECFNDEVNKKEAILHSIQVKLQMLRKDLAEILERPTMMNSNLGHVSRDNVQPIFFDCSSHICRLNVWLNMLGMLLLKI